MFNATVVFPNRKEARKLYLELWKHLLFAALGVGLLAIPIIRVSLMSRAPSFFTFGNRQITIQGWVFLLFFFCALFTVVSVTRWIALRVLPRNVRLLRSLTRNERLVLKHLANSAYGLTEGELNDLVPVPPQLFLRLIDRLVNELHFATRTEPPEGGAFWSLSEKGRSVAVANNLFRPCTTWNRLLILIILLVSVLPAVGYARIGETIAQCEARYGTALKTTGGVDSFIDEIRLYAKNGFSVVLGFRQGVCEMAAFTKVDNSPFSENEQQTLLQANAGASTWQRLREFSINLQWQRLDGDEFAQYEPFTKRMGFTSKAYLAFLNAAQAAKEKKSLDGF